MKKLLNIFVSRLFWFVLLLIVQLGFIVFFLYQFRYSLIIRVILTVFSYLVVVYIINRNDNPSYRLAWSIFILIFPLIGGFFYLLFGGRKIPKQLQRNMLKTIEKSQPLLVQDEKVIDNLKKIDDDSVKAFEYISNRGYFPVYENTRTVFCKTGEEKFQLMIDELKKAKHFIFLEYFIIEEGEFWNKILDILKEKASQGLDVRVMYDDAGCLRKLPNNYHEKLNKLGIKTAIFNPLRPTLAVTMNNRDHRKICVIDNNVGFVGGINLADEYINKTVRFGHWKDTAVMMEGSAVWSLTVAFLQFWNYIHNSENDDYTKYKLDPKVINTKGFVQPFSDSPTDNEEVGLNTHLNIINTAKEYVYIQTPYLVISYEMQMALTLAAKNGVDIRITVPHIPDKWYVHYLTQANYETLIDAGIKIYEYEPGFIHSKTFLSDDKIGLCGSINMDYRSYYLHYECGCLMYDSEAIKQMKDDYMETVDKSILITKEDCKKVNIFKRCIQALLLLFSPLL